MEKFKPTAKVILDSISPEGKRLTTVEVVINRWILAELNTHREFSRNSASSRAIPFSKTSKKVREQPAMSLHYGINQSGMSADNELSPQDIKEVEIYLLGIRDYTLDILEKLQKEYSLHKQVINRYIEPFMQHTVIISSTEWDNFFWQRCHPAADPNMKAAADAIQLAYYQSTPQLLKYGQWHMPYLDTQTIDEIHSNNILNTNEMLETCKMVSAARNGRVSYLTQDGLRDWQEDVALYNRLVTADVLHASPLEHVATPSMSEEGYQNVLDACDLLVCPGHDEIEYRPSNFKGWNQFRHQIQDLNPKGPFIPNHPLLTK